VVIVNGWQAFRTGLSRPLHYRWLLTVLFAVNLVSALLLAILPALSLATGLGRRPAIRQAGDGVDAWLVIETLMTPITGTALGEGGFGSEAARELQRATLLGLLTAAALPLLAWLPATFLSGGVLLTYAEAPHPFRWRRFLWGCCHWFGAFLLLSLVQGAFSSLIFIPVIAAAAGVVAVVGQWLWWVAVPLLGLVAALWVALTEYTRVAAVAGETRNVARAFSQAVRFVFRNFPAVTTLYGPALLLLGLLYAIYRWGLMPHLPLDWWPLVLVVQQAFILARLWARLVRLAGGTALYSDRSRRLKPGEQGLPRRACLRTRLPS
jgi:hypothetical protein